MRTRILLVEPDYYTRYPPLGLLKLAQYERSKGSNIQFVRGCVASPRPDRIYVTSLFTYSWRAVHQAVRFYKERFDDVKVTLGGIYASMLPEHAETSGADEVYVGLFPEAEDLMPAWDLIPEWDGSIIFASRGCVRKCGFCSVPKLEGRPQAFKYGIRHLIWEGHSRVILWDNNILGNANWSAVFDELAEIGKEVDFNQGLDARLLTDKVAEKLAALKFNTIRLAYDYKGVGPYVEKALERLEGVGIGRRRVVVYTLYNYLDDPENFKTRVEEILTWGAVCYPMRFEPLTSLTKNAYVSPRWTKTEVENVAQARRVIGFAGAFPPYDFLVKKFRKAKDFETAFKLRKPKAYHRKAKARNHLHPRWGGDRLEDAETAEITIGSPVGYADGAWQIGSIRPPNVCLSCGLSFNKRNRKIKGPYERGPYRYVCEWCWKLPFLFFPDKKLARCGECWVPPASMRHHHVPAFAPRGARVSKAAEIARRSAVSGHGRRTRKSGVP
jgi:pyruvate-formate lyase-activating enzyme